MDYDTHTHTHTFGPFHSKIFNNNLLDFYILYLSFIVIIITTRFDDDDDYIMLTMVDLPQCTYNSNFTSKYYEIIFNEKIKQKFKTIFTTKKNSDTKQEDVTAFAANDSHNENYDDDYDDEIFF